MPRLVYINISTLNTLDERIFNSGFGEIIKHAYIKDSEYLDYIKNNTVNIMSRQPGCLEEIIYKSCVIKGNVVEKDPTEKVTGCCLILATPWDMPLKNYQVLLYITENVLYLA